MSDAARNLVRHLIRAQTDNPDHIHLISKFTETHSLLLLAAEELFGRSAADIEAQIDKQRAEIESYRPLVAEVKRQRDKAERYERAHHHATLLRERQTEGLAEQRLLELYDVRRERDALRAQLADRGTLTKEWVREVVRRALRDGEMASTLERLAGALDAIAARAAEELAGAVVGLVGLSERDQEILSVLIDDVQAFGAGDEDDRKDERFQRDTLSLLRRLKRDAAPLAAAFDRAAVAITGQPAAELTAQLKPATASIGPADTAIIVEALEYTAARKPGAPIADIARIRAALTSGGGS